MLMSWKGRDVISIRGISRRDIEHVFQTAEKLRPIADERTKNTLLQDKILAALFFQPSTRTRLSFESAMQRLGGSVVGFASPEVTRAGDVYAETLKDTGEMVQLYSDVIAIRHPEADAPAILAETVDIPVISGGAGITSTMKSGSVGEHPTQTLLDLYTIFREKRKIDGLHILFLGNMGSRAIHSLGIGLSKFDDVQTYVLAPESLGLPDVAKKDFTDANLKYKPISSIKDVIKKLDIIYVVTMRQALGVERTPDTYRLDVAKLKEGKPDLIVLHPLPRMDEIPVDVDKTPFAKYYAQAYNGLIVRMALLALVLGREP
jgi:aspartate carbamoyltransferase catalytic subunit